MLEATPVPDGQSNRAQEKQARRRDKDERQVATLGGQGQVQG